ncbi:AraC family transcriptional regulator [Saccharibacillus sp. O23]|uniref:AraC family transcriptional regulator n=1 Tax=Saccharibacillus sp. O23 TaxID=2009338 RepID=UPI000B4E7210|nr:AraC family transcriptional regulator [Saccharibacillus sp. O23]OWR31997.1 AraC family transcriptional regulator [Saccharibacillus sp. O23]
MKKWNSVLARLAVSYLSVVLVLVLSLCSVFYLYSSNRYMEESQNRNQITLANAARTIDSEVLQRTQQLALRLALDKNNDLRSFRADSWRTQPSRLLALQSLLKSEADAEPDLIEAIHLYDPQSGALLSSQYGFVDRSDLERAPASPIGWAARMQTSSRRDLWMPSRIAAEDPFSALPGGSGQKLLTYAHGYPFQSSGADSDLILAIDVKEDAIRRILHNMMPFQDQETWILSADGETALAAEKAVADPAVGSAASASVGSGESGGRTDGESYTIFREPLASTGWMLYSATPHSVFQEQSLTLQRLVLVVSGLALLVGLLLSGVMTKLIYSPLKRLVGKIRHLADPSADAGHGTGNEYGLIDTALNRLSDRVSTLQETIEATGPIVKRSAVLKLLQGDSADASPKERLLLAGLFGEAESFRCLLLQLGGRVHGPDESGGIGGSGESAPTPAEIVRLLERTDFPGGFFVAAELPERRIAAILARRPGGEAADVGVRPGEFGPEDADAFARSVAAIVLDACRTKLGADVQLSWGREVDRPEALHLSCGDAQIGMKYAYFMPERAMLNDPCLHERENSEEQIPQPLLARFKEKLAARQPDEVAEAIEALIEAVRVGPYPADYGHFILSNIVFAYSDHLKSVRYRPAGSHPDLHRQYVGLAHIEEFRIWLLDSARAFLAETEKRNGERAIDTLEAAKRHIDEHLSGDLSLESVSSAVFISAKYLSRLFKEETGVTYTEYVTARRMEAARTLIRSGSLNVEQVAGSVGYVTPAYFIKKFKEAYGCTPGQYMRENQQQARSS